MQITFNPSKNDHNIAKHDVSLAAARMIDWENLWYEPDTRQDYGEVRLVGYGLIGKRLYCVVFTDRDDTRRIISLRKANPREVNIHENIRKN